MSVNTTGNYLKITRDIATKDAYGMSGSAFKLFICLNQLEAIDSSNGELLGDIFERMFLCTDQRIHDYTGMNIKTIQSAKKELKDRGLITISRGHWHYGNGKSDIKQPCVYKLK